MNSRIKQLRKSLNLTQEDFAKKIGIKRNTLANYEVGRNEPIDAVIFSIAREFNVNYDWLKSGEGEMFAQLDRDDELAAWAGKLLNPNNNNEFIKDFVYMLSQLEESDWVVIEKISRFMAKKK